MEAYHINILNIAAILLAAYLGGVLIRKVGYPAILGELLVGIILGPSMLGLLEYSAAIKVMAEIGIILLMVYIGMEIDFHDLKKASWAGLMAALGGFFVPFVLGYLVIVWTGGTPLAGLFVAIAIGVTSLATKSRILIDLKLLNTRIAYVMMAGALISDTLALVIFSGITNFAESSSINLGQLALIGGKILLFFGVTISVGTLVLPRLGTYISRSGLKNSTAYFTMILIVTFAYCELAELAGMHSILGAFMAGLFIKSNLFPRNISKELNKAFYDVSIGFMAPIFFVTAGFFVDVSVFKTDLLLLIGITLLAIVGKIVGTALFYLPSRNGWREGLTIGTGMNGRGAVEIIIAEIGLQMGIIDQAIFSILVFMAIFTTLTVPVLLNWTTKWLRKRGELVYVDKREGAIILGANPLGIWLAKQLAASMPVRLIDNNRELVKRAVDAGLDCIHGNAISDEDLEELAPENTALFIGLTTNEQVNRQAGKKAAAQFLVPRIYLPATTAETVDNTVHYLAITGNKLQDWFQRITRQQTETQEFKLEADYKAGDWQKEHSDVLPLLVQSTKNKQQRLFFADDTLKTGEKVITLRSK